MPMTSSAWASRITRSSRRCTKDTPSIRSIDVDDYDAVWVAGGGGPLLTFNDDTVLHQLIAAFYERGKIVALICHGSALLLWTRLSNGRLLV